MGFAEALSDDGSLTGRGHPLLRGIVCGAMTTLGGIGHTLPFLIPDFQRGHDRRRWRCARGIGRDHLDSQSLYGNPGVRRRCKSAWAALVFATGVLIGSW